MSDGDRIDQLKDRHARLEAAIQSEVGRPHPDELSISAMKREKLRIKDQIAAMERQTD